VRREWGSVAFADGVSPSGKAGDFESSIRWFESSHPSFSDAARMRGAMTHREALTGVIEAWRAGDAFRAAAHFAPDGTYREAKRDAIVGRDALVAYFTRFFRDGPAFAFHVDDTLVDGDRGAVRYRFAIAGPDGSWHERPGCAFVTFANGTIAEWNEYEG
jgi:uncharacterized protein (TIGR02246 family)